VTGVKGSLLPADAGYMQLGATPLWRPTCGLRWMVKPMPPYDDKCVSSISSMDLQQLWIDDVSGAKEWRNIDVVNLDAALTKK
jgi:hypothetical protein